VQAGSGQPRSASSKLRQQLHRKGVGIIDAARRQWRVGEADQRSGPAPVAARELRAGGMPVN
jgi:hypothetical protein